MITLRNDGSWLLSTEDGTELATVTPRDGLDEAELAALEAMLQAASGAGRVVVHLREGLLEAVAAEMTCEVVIVDEDRFDKPPVTLRRRRPEADPDAVAALLARDTPPG